MKIIFNTKEKTGRKENSRAKGSLTYNKKDKSFSCDAFDLEDMGINDLEREFDVMVEESGNVKTFVLDYAKKDPLCHLYISKDGRHRFFVWYD
jgi:hypothetical protein